MTTRTLAALEDRIRRDLAMIAHPSRPWLVPRNGPDGRPALDVLVVGAGQSGVTIGFGLKRAKVDNILVVDRAPEGKEGPWATYARMPTLRSPKDFTGPDLDIPSLTYQAWHEANLGAEDWERLHRIPKAHWNDYLLFVRRMTGVPVRNETAVSAIAPAEGGLLAVTLDGAAGREVVHARKVVLATGQEGTGRWWMPEFVAALPASMRAHTSEEIDFAALAGKVVAVLGAGASAFDNAATALEAGAREVRLFCRRPEPQTVQPYLWLTFRGFLQHLGDLPDEWRWRFMRRILELREGFPQETYERCARHPNFTMHVEAPWIAARAEGGRPVVTTPHGEFAADFLICGTGIDNDPRLVSELSGFADNIATWADRYTPPPEELNDRIGRFPYLGPDYAFTEKEPGRTPWIRDIHLFSINSTMSFGPSGSSINAMTTAVPTLVRGVTRGLFEGDVERLWSDFLAYDARIAHVRDTVRGLGAIAAE